MKSNVASSADSFHGHPLQYHGFQVAASHIELILSSKNFSSNLKDARKNINVDTFSFFAIMASYWLTRLQQVLILSVHYWYILLLAMHVERE